MYREFDDVYGGFDVTMTLKELQTKAEVEWEGMCDEEQHFRIIQCDPTFLQFLQTNMSMNGYERVTFNEYTYEYKFHN